MDKTMNDRRIKKQLLVLAALLYTIYIFLLPQTGFSADIRYWREWSIYIYQNGLSQAYGSGTNYMPLYLYVLYFYGLLQNDIEQIRANIYLLKIFTLLFDILGSFFVLKYIRDSSKHLFFFFLLMLNFAFIYNSLIWGQVDAIFSFFVFASVYFALEKKLLISILFYLIAINLKLQAIIFIPPLVLLLLPEIINRFRWQDYLKTLGSVCLLQFLILFPFIREGQIGLFLKVVLTSVDFYRVVSANAFNFWYLVFPGNLWKIHDYNLFWGISYKRWGNLFFFASSAAALFPLLRESFGKIKPEQQRTLSLEKKMVIMALIPLLFFFFNTQMHERYSHPALLFLAAYCFMANKYFPFIFVYLAYFLSLERVLNFFKLRTFDLVFFSPKFIAELYLLAIVILFYYLYKKEKSAENTGVENLIPE
jgi:Gpi18-like mannosyltransferase